MIDLVSSVIGFIIATIIFLVIIYVLGSLQRVPQVKLDGSFEKKPYCPECECYDLELVDTADGVPWLKGSMGVDYYRCKKCGHVFNDKD